MLMDLDKATHNFPLLYIMDPNPGKTTVLKYKFDKDEITTNNIREFVQDYLNGNAS